jgi:hypothetical protein
MRLCVGGALGGRQRTRACGGHARPQPATGHGQDLWSCAGVGPCSKLTPIVTTLPDYKLRYRYIRLDGDRDRCVQDMSRSASGGMGPVGCSRPLKRTVPPRVDTRVRLVRPFGSCRVGVGSQSQSEVASPQRLLTNPAASAIRDSSKRYKKSRVTQRRFVLTPCS